MFLRRTSLISALISIFMAWAISTVGLALAAAAYDAYNIYGSVGSFDLIHAFEATVYLSIPSAIATLFVASFVILLLWLPRGNPLAFRPRFAWLAGLAGGPLSLAIWLGALFLVGMFEDMDWIRNDGLLILAIFSAFNGPVFSVCHSVLMTSRRDRIRYDVEGNAAMIHGQGEG